LIPVASKRIFVSVNEYLSEALMPLYVRDDEVRDLANRLARHRKSNVTEALRAALKEALEREEEELVERRGRIAAILRRFKGAERRPGFTDRDLYDETGMPIL